MKPRLVLTPKHGCRCVPDASVTVEDVLLAMCEVIGGGKKIKSASRMNKAIVVFLSETALVDKLIEEGLVIKDLFVQVLPLSSPAKRVVLSNVPPYFEDEILERILSRYGKQTAPIRPVLVGFKKQTLYHVESFRLQTFMILSEQHRDLDVAVKLTHGGKDYVIYISSNSMKCFACGEHGHFRGSCPDTEQGGRPSGAKNTAGAGAATASRASGEPAQGERMPGPAPTPTVPVAETPGPAPLPTGPIADLPSPDPAPLAPGPVVDSQIPGPSGAGAQGAFNWREKRFFLTSRRQPTSEADEDRGIAASLEDATEEDAAEEGAEIAASLEDAEIAASLEDAAEDNAEIAASLEDAAEEDAHQTAGLQQLKPASQPERSSGKRKAKSRGGQAGAKTGRRTRSLERSGALSENESEIDFNEYQEVTMENVQQPVGESVEFPGKFVRKGKQNLYSITRLNKFLDDTKGQRKISLTSFFPDYNLFLLSSTAALRNATMTELTIQKRFRIKKLQSTVRAELSSLAKSTVPPNECS